MEDQERGRDMDGKEEREHWRMSFLHSITCPGCFSPTPLWNPIHSAGRTTGQDNGGSKKFFLFKKNFF